MTAMTGLPFAKYEGLGNDFVLIESADGGALGPEDAARICDRHFGVGADGVLLVTPSSGRARARMSVINADGSRPEMCGNGIRCVALHFARKDGATRASYVIDTDAGELACEVERDGNVAAVRSSLGRGRVLGELSFETDSQHLVFVLVSTGNPHAVVFDAGLNLAAIDHIAPRVSETIAGGSNVEFAELRDRSAIDLVVWERGVGRTLACGTGAAATLIAAASLGRLPYDEPTSVRLPGGTLEIAVQSSSHEARQRGPARLVFEGALP